MENPPNEPENSERAPDTHDVLSSGETRIADDTNPVTVAANPMPRIWTIPLVLVASFVCYIASSVIALFVAAFVVKGRIEPSMFGDEDTMQAVTQSSIGFPALVIIPQLAMIVPVIIAAVVSPEPFRQRLNLVRGRWPIWAWITAAVATPLIGMVSSAIVGSLMAESESLVEMTRVFRDLAKEGYLIPLAIMIGATPGICEELLFRGYVQTRLTNRWSGAIGITVTSLVFAVFHMDIVHSTAVFAIGMWLGWICWQSGSIFPAMLAHFVNNAISVVAVTLGPEPGSEEVSLAAGFVILGVLTIGFGAFLLTIASARRYRLAPISMSAESQSGPIA